MSSAASAFSKLFTKIAKFSERLSDTWHSSLRLRVVVGLIGGGAVVSLLIGVAIVSSIRASIFSEASRTYIEQFTREAAIGQENFTAAVSPTPGQTQQVANQLVASMYEPNQGLLGATLIRSDAQISNGQIIEPSTASATTIRSLITPELSMQVSADAGIAWQSVEVQLDPEGSAPGMLVGTAIQIPNAGAYNLYALYSLETQENLLNATVRALWLGLGIFAVGTMALTYLILRTVLRPIREASKNAQRLAEGEFDVRMKVNGDDELAQLAHSFNTMAASLDDQFTKLERMSAVQTSFVSMVSHELRSPVTTIRMAGQLIYDKREELPSALKRSAELQHAQVQNLDAMLSDLLEISRYDAGAMALVTESVDVGVLVQKVVDALEPLALDNGVIARLRIEGSTNAEIEPRRIERIVRNLVVNAFEYAEGKPVDILVIGNESAVAVEVMDHGVGLTSDQAAHVFDRFWRADSSRVRKTGGTGLGLTIAREDALIHGGSLAATGELGSGATFLLTIPKVPGAKYVSPLTLRAPKPLAQPQLEQAEQSRPPESSVPTHLSAPSQTAVADASLAGDRQEWADE